MPKGFSPFPQKKKICRSVDVYQLLCLNLNLSELHISCIHRHGGTVKHGQIWKRPNSQGMFGCVKNRGYSKITAIRNSNVHSNSIFAIRNSYNSCYSLFLVNVRITAIQKCEERKKNIISRIFVNTLPKWQN